MSTDIAERFAQPCDLDRLTIAFCTTTSVMDLMPAYADLPKEFKSSSNNPFVAIQRQWFFEGLPKWPLTPKPDIDRYRAIGHLTAIQRSCEPPHEHKAAGVAYLMSLWFEPPN